MTSLRRTVRIDHTADNLFALVSEIDRYPQFIRWIKSMQVVPVSENGSAKTVIGKARVGFKGFSEKLATRVETHSEDRTIKVRLVEGPLNKLDNAWKFTPAGDATDVEFFVDFEFRNFILRALAAANFEIAVNLIMMAFIDEADRRYGKR